MLTHFPSPCHSIFEKPCRPKTSGSCLFLVMVVVASCWAVVVLGRENGCGGGEMGVIITARPVWVCKYDKMVHVMNVSMMYCYLFLLSDCYL